MLETKNYHPDVRWYWEFKVSVGTNLQFHVLKKMNSGSREDVSKCSCSWIDLSGAQPLNAPGNFQFLAFSYENEMMEIVREMENKKARGLERETKASA